jgi:hypothetical protein
MNDMVIEQRIADLRKTVVGKNELYNGELAVKLIGINVKLGMIEAMTGNMVCNISMGRDVKKEVKDLIKEMRWAIQDLQGIEKNL